MSEMDSEQVERARRGTRNYAALIKIVPSLNIFQPSAVRCQYCSGRFANVSSVIQHLNDDHKLSREEIADRLDTLDVDLTVKPIKETASGNAIVG